MHNHIVCTFDSNIIKSESIKSASLILLLIGHRFGGSPFLLLACMSYKCMYMVTKIKIMATSCKLFLRKTYALSGGRLKRTLLHKIIKQQNSINKKHNSMFLRRLHLRF